MVKELTRLFQLRKKKSNKQLRYISQSVVLEETVNPHMIRITMLVICFAFIVFLFWTSMTKVNEIANVSGKVIPNGYTQTVQHLEGGVVAEILISDGELVEKGETLLRLDSSGATEDYLKLNNRQSILALQAERLRAFIENRHPNFSQIDVDQSLVKDQQNIFEGMVAARNSEKQVIQNQIEQRKSDLAILNSKEDSIDQTLAIVEEIIASKKTLLDKGLVPRLAYLEARKELNIHRGEKEKVIALVNQAKESIDEYKNRLQSLKAKLTEDALKELGSIENEISQNQETLTKLHKRVKRLEVKSPVKGIISGLAVNTVGAVLVPGEVLMEIIPLEKKLIVETYITPFDIGHITIGQPVQVKVNSFDFSRYGLLEGELEFVSATTFTKDTGESFYKGRVSIEKNYVGQNPTQNIILPGMTVEVDIITGERTILSYLLKPFQKSLSTSFSER